MPTLYPTALRVAGKRCLVLGGGTVAERKVAGLLEAGADVTVVSPEITDGIRQQVSENRLGWISRTCEPRDLTGAFLVIAATNDVGVNRRLCEEAERLGLLCNNVTDPASCNFIVPSVVRRGDLLVSITTCGDSPAMARWLREKLETTITPAYGELASLLGRLRDEINRQLPDPEIRSRVLRQLIEEKILPLIERGDVAAAEEAITSCTSS